MKFDAFVWLVLLLDIKLLPGLVMMINTCNCVTFMIHYKKDTVMDLTNEILPFQEAINLNNSAAVLSKHIV